MKNEYQKHIIKFDGGLGNQMFQYAFGKSLEKKGCCEIYYDNGVYIGDNPYRQFNLDIFKINDIKFIQAKYKKSIFKKILKECLVLKKFKQNINILEECNFKKYKKVKQKNNSFYYDESLYHLKENAYITGFFQNSKYFDDIREIILKNFQLDVELSEKNKNLLSKIQNSNSCSIHIRRGDYVLLNNFDVLPFNYYQEAMTIINSKYADTIFYVFSDDIEWCKNFFHDDSIFFVDNNLNYIDLELMKNCKNNIIANSTFSWWAAYLNNNPNKTVIAPIPIFTRVKNSYEFIPSDWTTIKWK